MIIAKIEIWYDTEGRPGYFLQTLVKETIKEVISDYEKICKEISEKSIIVRKNLTYR